MVSEPRALAPWIRVERGLWFDPSEYAGCSRRPRNGPPRLIVGHWTGGEAGTQRYDDDGLRVANVLRTRRNEVGDPMPLSIHFVIGGDGTVWQMADPLLTQCRHASAVNPFSIGIEVVNKGLPPSFDGRKRDVVAGTSRNPQVLAFYPAQLDAWWRLVELLCYEYGIARAVPGKLTKSGELALTSARVEQYRLRKFRGVIEHLHCSSQKPDAGMQLVRELAHRGYAITEV